MKKISKSPKGKEFAHTQSTHKKKTIVRQFQRQNYYVALCQFFFQIFLFRRSQVFAQETGR